MAINGQTTVDDVTRTAKNKAKDIKGMADKAQSQFSESATTVTEAVTEKAQRLADQLQDLSQTIRVRAGEARERTSETVTRHPFYSVGAAAVVGMAVGYLFSRKK